MSCFPDEYRDVDECDETKFGKQHGCQDKCVNTFGSYKCACGRGYVVAADGRTCIIGEYIVNEMNRNKDRKLIIFCVKVN